MTWALSDWVGLKTWFARKKVSNWIPSWKKKHLQLKLLFKKEMELSYLKAPLRPRSPKTSYVDWALFKKLGHLLETLKK